MKKIILFLTFLIGFIPLHAQTETQQKLADAYLEKYSGFAVEEMMRSGVPASITLAQGMLESNYGRSELAVKANNHFGIQCHGDAWKGKRYEHMDAGELRQFRKYKSVLESYEDHSNFLLKNKTTLGCTVPCRWHWFQIHRCLFGRCALFVYKSESI